MIRTIALLILIAFLPTTCLAGTSYHDWLAPKAAAHQWRDSSSNDSEKKYEYVLDFIGTYLVPLVGSALFGLAILTRSPYLGKAIRCFVYFVFFLGTYYILKFFISFNAKTGKPPASSSIERLKQLSRRITEAINETPLALRGKPEFKIGGNSGGMNVAFIESCRISEPWLKDYDDDELAFIIGHEFTHASRVMSACVYLTLFIFSSIWLIALPFALKILILLSVQIAWRAAETICDKAGMIFAFLAGYNIRGGIRLFDRLRRSIKAIDRIAFILGILFVILTVVFVIEKSVTESIFNRPLAIVLFMFTAGIVPLYYLLEYFYHPSYKKRIRIMEELAEKLEAKKKEEILDNPELFWRYVLGPYYFLVPVVKFAREIFSLITGLLKKGQVDNSKSAPLEPDGLTGVEQAA